MEALAFKQIPVFNNFALQTVGQWYHTFLYSKEQALRLKVPCFDRKDQLAYVEYILFGNLLYKVVSATHISEFFGTALFDIFKYPRVKSKKGDFSLPYSKTENGNLRFGSDTIVPMSRFYPVFKHAQLGTGSYNEPIVEAFYLFAAIAKNQILAHPVLLDLESDISVFVSRSFKLASEKILTMSARTSEFQQDEELDAFLTTLSGSDVHSALFYKYPYNVNISSIFKTQLRKARQFELIFGTRLHYTQIHKEDILLRPYEVHQGSEPDIMPLLNNVEVIQTAHSKDLYTKLIELKDVWRGFENRFKTPFPARWLMCINQDQACEYWITQYHRDFPSVQGTISQDVESIIRLIHDLNWPKALGNLNRKASVVVPASFFFPEVTTLFKGYIQNLFGAVVEFEDVINGTIESDEVIVLDAFNVTMLSNLTHLTKRYKIKIVAPDFLYYIHQPFLKYHIAKHQIDPSLLGARSIIDSTFGRSEADWSQKRRYVLSGIRASLKKYHKAVGVEDDGDIDFDEDVEPDASPDFVSDPMLEDEVVTLVSDRQIARSSDLNERILISTINAKEYSLLPSTKVLLQERGFLLNATASALEAKMLFTPITQITRNIDAESLAVKLSTMPSDALKWKELLKGKCKSVDQTFAILKKQGLIVSLQTFSNEWQRADEYEAKGEFHLPRSYKDWMIVCQYLNIEETDRAWDCRKGRAHQNSLKRAFVEVIKFLNDEGAYGVNLDDYIVERIASIYERETGESSTDGLDRISHARSVVKRITKNFILEEINTVKKLNYG